MPTMSTDADCLVIGGGVVGLAIARALLEAGREVLLVERNSRLGQETTSRNSEVVHAGLYYKPGSLRARLCVKGKRKLYDFAANAGVPIERCGKLLVATSEDDLQKLRSIEETAAQNGVTDLRRLTREEAQSLEPELNCVAATLSPSTGVIDSHSLVVALEGHVTSLGGMIVLNTTAQRIGRADDGTFLLECGSGDEVVSLTSKAVVVAGGLGTSDLVRTLPAKLGYSPPATYYAKGHYFALSGRAPFHHLVYPMPTGSWLGVHFTRDVSGRAKFGPDFEWCDEISYAFDDADNARRTRFAKEIRRYWPNLPEDALHPDYTGIRPKISRENSTAADFAIHGPADHGIEGLVALYGIDSPGLTSSLAIADLVCARLT